MILINRWYVRSLVEKRWRLSGVSTIILYERRVHMINHINYITTTDWREAVISDEEARRFGRTLRHETEFTGEEPISELTIVSGADLPDEVKENIPGGVRMVNEEYYYVVVQTPTNTYPYRLVRTCASDKQRRRAEADCRRAHRYGWD
jgi:hypothetical protein